MTMVLWLLQIKDSGAWRNVFRFHPESFIPVKKLGTDMMYLQADSKVVLRIIQPGKRGEEAQVISYCEPGNSWNWRDV
jgi:hypothetical protein